MVSSKQQCLQCKPVLRGDVGPLGVRDERSAEESYWKTHFTIFKPILPLHLTLVGTVEAQISAQPSQQTQGMNTRQSAALPLLGHKNSSVLLTRSSSILPYCL